MLRAIVDMGNDWQAGFFRRILRCLWKNLPEQDARLRVSTDMSLTILASDELVSRVFGTREQLNKMWKEPCHFQILRAGRPCGVVSLNSQSKIAWIRKG